MEIALPKVFENLQEFTNQYKKFLQSGILYNETTGQTVMAFTQENDKTFIFASTTVTKLSCLQKTQYLQYVLIQSSLNCSSSYFLSSFSSIAPFPWIKLKHISDQV